MEIEMDMELIEDVKEALANYSLLQKRDDPVGHKLTMALRQRFKEAASALRSSGEADGFEAAWHKVCDALDYADPDWMMYGPEGADAASVLIRKLATPASAWRPIAEAPRDGTRVLLSYDNEMHIGGCASTDKYWRIGYDAYGYIEEFYASHWMPLPAPPTSTKGG